MDRSQEFFNDYNALREKYPEVYLESWTPGDFAGELGEEDVDWDDPRWPEVVHELGNNADATRGTNWDSVNNALRRLFFKV